MSIDWSPSTLLPSLTIRHSTIHLTLFLLSLSCCYQGYLGGYMTFLFIRIFVSFSMKIASSKYEAIQNQEEVGVFPFAWPLSGSAIFHTLIWLDWGNELISWGVRKMNCLNWSCMAISSIISIATLRFAISMKTSNSSKHRKGDSISSHRERMKQTAVVIIILIL